MREVGFELYQDMLHETIARLQSGEIEMEGDGEWSPQQINLGVPVLIPEAYVPDLDVRLDCTGGSPTSSARSRWRASRRN